MAFTEYDDVADGRVSLISAVTILPPIIEEYGVRSVIDFGCGLGCWLEVAQECGVSDVVGVDGPAGRSPGEFIEHDLTKPFYGDEHDLAICLEVAEHLPESAARTLVKSLVRAAPLILFSAATPGQGGEGHINEQPHAYWDEMVCWFGYDVVPVAIDGMASAWYRNNIRLYRSWTT
jgi:hypothetical protein